MLGDLSDALGVEAAAIDAGELTGFREHVIRLAGEGVEGLTVFGSDVLHAGSLSGNRRSGRAVAGRRHKKARHEAGLLVTSCLALLGGHAELDATVGFAAILGAVVGDRLRFAIADGRQATRINAVLDQELLDRHRALL